MRHEINKILQGKNHNIGTYRSNKMYFSCNDNKKHVPEDRCSRLTKFNKPTH